MIKVLFICGQNRLRSPTAEAVFSEYPGVEALSAGLNNDAECPVSADLLEWADIIFVMEKSHRAKLSKRFQRDLKGKRLITLDIPDNYAYMAPDLVELLKTRVSRFLPTPSSG